MSKFVGLLDHFIRTGKTQEALALIATQVNDSNVNNMEFLKMAVVNNRIEIAKSLIAKNALVGMTDEKKFELVMKAALNGSSSFIRLFKEEDISEQMKDSTGRSVFEMTSYTGKTVLHYAAEAGDYETIFAIGDSCLEATTGFGHTPLYVAVDNQNLAAMKALLELGADSNCHTGSSAPLTITCTKGFVEGARLLLAYGANPKGSNGKGGAPLYSAAFFGQLDILKLLLDAAHDLTLSDLAIPLSLAVQQNKLQATNLLLERGAPVNYKLGQQTLLHLACKSDANIEVVQCLLKHGADTTIKTTDYLGVTALHIAARSQSLLVAGALLAKGANIFQTDASNHTSAEYLGISKSDPDSLDAVIHQVDLLPFEDPVHNETAKLALVRSALRFVTDLPICRVEPTGIVFAVQEGQGSLLGTVVTTELE